mgnify:CR=1
MCQFVQTCLGSYITVKAYDLKLVVIIQGLQSFNRPLPKVGSAAPFTENQYLCFLYNKTITFYIF